MTTDEAPDEAEENGDENAGVTFAFAFSICWSASRGPKSKYNKFVLTSLSFPKLLTKKTA